MRNIAANKADKVILNHLIREPHKPKQIADDTGYKRPYIAERIKRMTEHEWADREASGLYSISPIGRRKYAELDDTGVDNIEDFVRIYGPSMVIHLITHLEVHGGGEGHSPVVESDVPFSELSDELDIRTDHLEVALDILIAAIRDGDDGGAGEDVREWIAPSSDLGDDERESSGNSDEIEQVAD